MRNCQSYEDPFVHKKFLLFCCFQDSLFVSVFWQFDYNVTWCGSFVFILFGIHWTFWMCRLIICLFLSQYFKIRFYSVFQLIRILDLWVKICLSSGIIPHEHLAFVDSMTWTWEGETKTQWHNFLDMPLCMTRPHEPWDPNCACASNLVYHRHLLKDLITSKEYSLGNWYLFIIETKIQDLTPQR